MGAATLDQLAQRGVKVFGIDRFAPPHAEGSSHGETRITRQAIGEGAFYTPLVLRSHAIWRELEAQTGEGLLRTCGFMAIDSAGGRGALHGKEAFVARTLHAAQVHGIEHERLNPAEASHRFPAFRIPENAEVYFEPGGGLVYPERCIAAQLWRARQHGAQIRMNTPVISIHAHSGGVELQTADLDRFSADHVVLSCGGWISGLLETLVPRTPHTDAPLPLHLLRQSLNWFEPRQPAWLGPSRFPTFIWSLSPDSGDGFYGFPLLSEGTNGVKLAQEQYDTVMASPETPAGGTDRARDRAEGSAFFRAVVAGRINGVSPRPVHHATCFYTQTPDGDFVVDRHPAHPNLHLVSACSGHGFKHSAGIGERIAREIVDGLPSEPRFSALRWGWEAYDAAAHG